MLSRLVFVIITSVFVAGSALLVAGSHARPTVFCFEPGYVSALAGVEESSSNRRVEVGGTQIERDDAGRIWVRIRDIVVRDGNGEVVASAPKAEGVIRSCPQRTHAR